MPLVGNRSAAIRRGKARPERVQRRNAQRREGPSVRTGGSSACRASAAALSSARSGVSEHCAYDTVQQRKELSVCEAERKPAKREVAGYACQSPSLFLGEGPASGEVLLWRIFCIRSTSPVKASNERIDDEAPANARRAGGTRNVTRERRPSSIL